MKLRYILVQAATLRQLMVDVETFLDQHGGDVRGNPVWDNDGRTWNQAIVRKPDAPEGQTPLREPKRR